jgi:tetratricopeptide (TPR) repeat protein
MMKRSLFLLIIPLILNSCTLTKERYPVLGIDSIRRVSVFEKHSDALLHWMQMGIKDAILINIDTHDDIRWIPDEKIDKLAELYNKKDWESIKRADSLGDRSLYNVGNFIYAAARLGIIRELYWIIPFAKFSTPDPLDGVKRLLRTYSFPEDSVRTFSLIKGCARGSFYDIPVNICGIEHPPEINEPAILSIDVDFYPPMPVDYPVDRATSIKMLFASLFRMDYQVRDAVVAYSVHGGYLRSYHRWMGDVSVDILKDPSLLNNMPELWSILSAADYYLKTGQYDKLIPFLNGVKTKYPDSKPIDVYLAFAYQGIDRLGEALDMAKMLCVKNRNYCYTLIELGIEITKTANPEKAEPFFKNGYAMNPDIDFGQIYFANALRRSGRYEEAIRYYMIFKRMNGSYPVDLLIGETYLMMDNNEKAGEFFDSARLALRRRRYVDVKNRVVSQALRAAVDYYEKKGLKEYADELRNDRRIADLLR